MKIVCNACSKKYDPVATSGTCPYCGMHATDEQIAEAQTNNVIKGGSVKEMLRSYLNEKIRKDKKSSPLRNTKAQLILCSALAAAMLGVALWGNNHYKKRLEVHLSNIDTSDVSTEKLKTGDTFTLRGDVFRIVSCKVLTEYQDKVEGPFKLIEISYSDDGSNSYSGLSSVYVSTANGATAMCLDLYNVSEIMGLSRDELKLRGYTDRIFSTDLRAAGKEEGYSRADRTYKVIFAVPENETTHTLLINSSRESRDTDYVIDLRYEITVKEGDGL